MRSRSPSRSRRQAFDQLQARARASHRSASDRRATRPRSDHSRASADLGGRDDPRDGDVPEARPVSRRRRRVSEHDGAAAELPAVRLVAGPAGTCRRSSRRSLDGRRRRLPRDDARPAGAACDPGRCADDHRHGSGGKPAEFTPWFGALAHAIFFRQGTLDYFHTHVCAPGASGCTSFLGAAKVTGSSSTPGKLDVGVLVPLSGVWRLFLQCKVNGHVLTAPFTLTVKP